MQSPSPSGLLDLNMKLFISPEIGSLWLGRLVPTKSELIGASESQKVVSSVMLPKVSIVFFFIAVTAQESN
ncbi:hypothetical protein Bpfe_028249 [Biomphalaria pfeifferi]|uniref:Uncharacterized protein n=1 Tax=Biomphalaria pfeifferi TaxID=112525 RepID=A0AAD8AUZ2_BIOPF|nr:hypothetical protein Bpfe_028249 [Biomphalaria pfeifferi]